MNVMRSGGAQGHVNHTQLVHIPEAHGKKFVMVRKTVVWLKDL